MVKWFGKKLCDAGFLINLKSRKDRYSRAINELKKSGINGVKRFDAVIIDDPNFIKYGCTQSHIDIAKLQLENDWEYVLYLEDDIVSDFYYKNSLMSANIDKKEISKNIIKELNDKKPDILWLGVRLESETEYVSNFLVKPKETLMSHAYLGSKKYAKFLIDNLIYQDGGHFSGRYPIDFFISQITSKNDWRLDSFDKDNIMKNNDLVVYVTVPMIFNQGESFSDLTDNYVNYVTWVRGCFEAYANIDKLNIKPLLNE